MRNTPLSLDAIQQREASINGKPPRISAMFSESAIALAQEQTAKLRGAAGTVYSPEDMYRCLNQGLDFVLLGRAAMLHHNYPLLLRDNTEFSPNRIPVSRAYLRNEGLSDKFLDYVAGMWPDFISV